MNNINKKLLLTIFLHVLSFSTSGALSFIAPKKWVHPEIPLDPQHRTGSYPYVSGDLFRAVCDFVIDETDIPFNPDEVKHGDTIFVGGNYVDFFFDVVYYHITVPFILVTHNSVLGVPDKYARYLQEEKLIAWFGKNPLDNSHPKLFPIPNGIPNKHWPWGDIHIIDAIRANLPAIKKDKLLYMNFALETNLDSRQNVQDFFCTKDFCTLSSRKPFDQYLQELAESKFVLSPPGKGLDCHRIWETLLMGSIPVVLSSTLDPLFDDLPVLIVNDWQEVTEEFLEATYEQMTTKTYNMQKLFGDYWLRQIGHVKQAAKKELAGSIPNGFGINFHDSMEHIDHDRYKRETAAQIDEYWPSIKSLYDTYVINDLEYAPQPRIPKIIHQVWLGSPFPDKYRKFQLSWIKNHPDWEYKLWTEKEIQEFGLVNKKMYNEATNYGQKADIAIYEILYREGGLYVDTDFECLRSLDVFHHCFDFYTGTGFGAIFTLYFGLVGSVPGHPILKTCIETLNKDQKMHPDEIINILFTTGPYHFSNCLKKEILTCPDRCVAFPVGYFYPWPNTLRDENKPEQIRRWIRPETFAIHHWHVAWNDGVAPGQTRKPKLHEVTRKKNTASECENSKL